VARNLLDHPQQGEREFLADRPGLHVAKSAMCKTRSVKVKQCRILLQVKPAFPLLNIGKYASRMRPSWCWGKLGHARPGANHGLVNAHHHSHVVSGILHGVSADLLEPWILAWHGMRAVDPQLRAWYGAWRQPPLQPWITCASEH
jgi:hypothetical protein